MEICTSVDSLSWAPHPIAEGVEIKPLVTKKTTAWTLPVRW